MAGIYISWPFCAQKCTYCNFASGVFPRDLGSRYLEALVREIESHDWEWEPTTLYLGGGTPGSMEPGSLDRLLRALPRNKWHEATIEAAPGTITSERLCGWRATGINRVSLGVQSFIRNELARTGRKHDAQIVEREVGILRANGILNINIDLIAGLPGQTEASWRESVAAAMALGVPHISVYMLEVDEDSRLGSEILLGGKRYGAPDVPDGDRIADFYEIAVTELRRAGIDRYEISNFARPGAESIHNLKYWRREPYVGFGADAHSFDGRSRQRNVETAGEYVSRAERGETVRAELTPAHPVEEKFFLGLRLAEGVEANPEDWRMFKSVFERFEALGALEYSGGRVRLTDPGVLVSNEVFQEFLAS